MNLLLHHLRKDLRHSRGFMLMTLLVAAGMLWLPAVPPEDRAKPMIWLPLFRYGGWFMLFLTAGRLVQLDAPLRDTAWFRTRPVPLATWLGSKLLTVLALIVPMALIECVMLMLIGLRPGFTDLLLVFAEEMLASSAIAGVAMAMAARKESPSQYHASVLIWATVLMIGWILFENSSSWVTRYASSWFARYEETGWTYSLECLEISRSLTIQLTCVAGVLTGLAIFVRSRRRETLGGALVFTFFCAIAAWFFWPVNIVKVLAPAEATAPRNEWPDPAKLGFSFVERRVGPKGTSRFTFGDVGRRSGTFRRIKGFTHIEGVPEGWFAYSNHHESELTLSTGEILPSREVSWGGLGPWLILPAVGIPIPHRSDNQTGEVDLGEFPLSKLASAMTGARLKGTIQVPLKRPVILARLPLRPGQVARTGNRHLRIIKVAQRDRVIDYELIVESLGVRGRGDWIAEPHRRIVTIVIHAGKREFLTMAGQRISGDRSGHYDFQHQELSETIWRDPLKGWDDSPIPDDWLDGAELLVLGDESGGMFSQDFDFADVTLRNEP